MQPFAHVHTAKHNSNNIISDSCFPCPLLIITTITVIQISLLVGASTSSEDIIPFYPPDPIHTHPSLSHLHCTSRYMACESCPMVLLAVHTYSPASVYWISLRVRDDTRAWLRTTMRPSRVWQERNWESGVGLRAALQLRDRTNTNLPHSSPPVLSTWKRSPGRWNHGHSTTAAQPCCAALSTAIQGNGNKKKRNEGPKYRMLLHNWGQLDNIKLLLRLTTAEIQLWLKHFCQDAFAENLHSKYCFHTENLRLTLLSLILVLFLHPWSGISKNRSKPQSWIRQNESSELSLEHSTKQSKVQRIGQANYGTLLKTACFKVLWCSKKILEQTLLIVSQFRNCSHKQECRDTNERERQGIKSRLSSAQRDCSHPGIQPKHPPCWSLCECGQLGSFEGQAFSSCFQQTEHHAATLQTISAPRACFLKDVGQVLRLWG